MKKKKPKIEQTYRVRFFITRTYDIEVDSFEPENARLKAKIKLYEGRGKGFKKGRALWAIESWVDPVDAKPTDDSPNPVYVGNLDHPLFIVDEKPKPAP